MSFNTFIEGSLPEMSAQEQVIYPDYNEKYEYKSNAENPNTRKLIETRSSIKYLVVTVGQPPDLKRSFRIEHNERIHFSVCKSQNELETSEKSASVQLMTKRLSVSYTQSDSQLKFSSANFVRALSSNEANPCDSNDCSLFAECVVDADTEKGYYCQCKPGFDDDGKSCVDVNECEEGSNYCSPWAECRNLIGYFECICVAPRVGDGRVCELEDETDQNDVCSRCDPNAACVTDENSNSLCVCKNGFVGNGFQCQQGKIHILCLIL